MSIVGIFGILLGALSWQFAMIDRSYQRTFVFGLIITLHACASLFYYQFAVTNGADTNTYYLDIYGYNEDPLRPGTVLVVQLVQLLKNIFGGTYLDLFFIFQAIGAAGIILLGRSFEEIYRELGVRQPGGTFLLLLLPGMHFWTSMIGKDAPLFFAVALAVWGAMQVRRRWLAIVVAVLIMGAIRPHVAVVTTVAAAITVMLDSRTPPGARFGLLLVALVGVAAAAARLESYINVNIYDPESVSAFLESQNEIGADHEAAEFSDAPLIVRMGALLFMPLFFGVEDMFGMIASVENVIIGGIIGYLIWNSGTVLQLFRKVAFVRFSLMLGIALILMLSLVYYNVGLGLRQKMMMMPALLLVLIAVLAVRAKKRLLSDAVDAATPANPGEARMAVVSAGHEQR